MDRNAFGRQLAWLAVLLLLPVLSTGAGDAQAVGPETGTRSATVCVLGHTTGYGVQVPLADHALPPGAECEWTHALGTNGALFEVAEGEDARVSVRAASGRGEWSHFVATDASGRILTSRLFCGADAPWLGLPPGTKTLLVYAVIPLDGCMNNRNSGQRSLEGSYTVSVTFSEGGGTPVPPPGDFLNQASTHQPACATAWRLTWTRAYTEGQVTLLPACLAPDQSPTSRCVQADVTSACAGLTTPPGAGPSDVVDTRPKNDPCPGHPFITSARFLGHVTTCAYTDGTPKPPSVDGLSTPHIGDPGPPVTLVPCRGGTQWSLLVFGNGVVTCVIVESGPSNRGFGIDLSDCPQNGKDPRVDLLGTYLLVCVQTETRTNLPRIEGVKVPRLSGWEPDVDLTPCPGGTDPALHWMGLTVGVCVVSQGGLVTQTHCATHGKRASLAGHTAHACVSLA